MKEMKEGINNELAIVFALPTRDAMKLRLDIAVASNSMILRNWGRYCGCATFLYGF